MCCAGRLAIDWIELDSLYLHQLIGGSYVIVKRKKRKISKRYKRMCEVYNYFSRDWKHICDYSDKSMMEMFLYETYGEGNPGNSNGYFLGKKWMDVNLEMWKEDIERGLLFKLELYDDPDIPNWWLDKHLPSWQVKLGL